MWNLNAHLQILVDGQVEIRWSTDEAVPYPVSLAPRALVALGPTGISLASQIKLGSYETKDQASLFCSSVTLLPCYRFQVKQLKSLYL